jgi:CRP/FNR family transcriptional regulator
MSREIVRDHGMMLLLGNMKAEERLITFLLDISRRLKTRGFSPLNFYLRMSRQEIGNYLGLKLETVSRILSKLQKEGVISVCNKHIQLTNIESLNRKIENPFCD